jgi:hypothetical protein
MQYVKASGNTVEKFPYSIGLLRKENPNTSFPKKPSDAVLASWGVYPVTEASDPDYDPDTQRVVMASEPVQVNGAWIRAKTVEALSAEQIQAASDAKASAVRAIRDEKLAETDWTGLSDVTMSAEMATYRQALRDITDHANFPNLEDADWPTKP